MVWSASVAYDEVVAPLTHVVLASAVFLGVRWLYAWWGPFARVARGRAVAFLDKISVYVYVCHSLLIGGPVLRTFGLPLPLALRLPLFLALTVAMAW